MTDLTERLAAKLAEDWRDDFALSVASWAPQILRLFLSEPELVAGLAPEVKREVLNQMVSANYRDEVARGDKLAAMVWLNALNYTAGSQNGNDHSQSGNLLPPSPAPMEGRSNE